MNSRERLRAAWDGTLSDYIPLTTWCFGLSPPAQYRWSRDGREVAHWYSGRMELLHQIPGGWTASDEIARFRAWQQLGLDDMLEISVPWSRNPEVTLTDDFEASTGIMTRRYQTPDGPLVHSVRRSSEIIPEGWVTQPEVVELVEDFNIPRGVKHLVAGQEDVPKLKHVFAPPAEAGRDWFSRRMGSFAVEPGAPVQAWTAFGVDAAVWFCGVEGALFLALDHPESFRELLDTIAAVDLARTELAAAHPATDIVVMRGWYSSTDFWSPALFREFLMPDIAGVADTAHRYGKKCAYVMTTGVDLLGRDLAEAGVDLLYFVDPSDPVSGGLELSSLLELTDLGLTLVGGISSLVLHRNDPEEIDVYVKKAVASLGPTGRFILHPVDALFPDTDWRAVTCLIEAWRRHAQG